MEARAVAYTSSGGAFFDPKVNMTIGVPANRIYLCEGIGKEEPHLQLITVIHELAHYVSGSPFVIGDQMRARFPEDQKRLDALAPHLKVRNAEHYAWYAFDAGLSKLPK